MLLASHYRPDVKPPASAVLDRAHPLAAGLRVFVPFNEGPGQAPEDVVGSLPPFGQFGNKLVWVDSPWGRSPQFDGSFQQYLRSNQFFGGANDRTLHAQLPVSFALAFNFSSLASITELFFIAIDALTNSISGPWSNINSSKFNANFSDAVGGTRTKTGGTTLATGQWYVLSASMRGATDMSVYVNGIDDGGSYSGSGGAIAYTSAPIMNIGYPVGGAGTWGTMAWFAYWARNLTDREHLELAKQGPFGMFRRPMLIMAPPPPQTLTDGFIASVTQVFTPKLVGTVDVPFIASHTAVYALAVQEDMAVPFIASHTTVYAPTLTHAGNEVDVPFLASATRVFGVFSAYWPDGSFSGIPGNGGESFLVTLAPAGASHTATLTAALTSSGTLLSVTGDGSWPSTPFTATVDDETMYLQKIAAGSYRITRRGLGNTTPASHLLGASATWNDTYEEAIVADVNVDYKFTADISGSGSTEYLGWLICFDSTQAYLGGDLYPMHVTEVVGVFDPGVGTTGASKLDAAQPNAVCTTAAVSDDCPAALSNPALLTASLTVGNDVIVLRYTNPEASELILGSRSVACQAWYGLKRVDATDVDVTLTDPTGNVVDGTINGEFDNPLGPGIGPDTGEPSVHDVAYTTVTLPGTDRVFTYGPPHYSETGWPMCTLAVRHGTRRVPYWKSWDWRDYAYVYSGFNTDATFCQILINRNGILFGGVPDVDLPGPQDIDGPDAVWDDGSYRFGASWYVALVATPYIVAGPVLGGTSTPSASVNGFAPTVTFTVPGTPVITVPFVEGGSGGGISPPTTVSRFDASVV